MTPETTTAVVYLLQYMLGVPPQPFSIVTVPNLPSLEECTYLAHELLPGIPDPKFRCIRYQTTVAAAPEAGAAAVDPDSEDGFAPLPIAPPPAAKPVAAVANCEAEGLHYQCQVPRDVKTTPDPNLATYLARATTPVRPKQKHGYGTIFGFVPDDGRAAPINELLSHIRAAIFCGLIVPGFCRPVQG